ncbi:MAG: hypothetical protein H0T76_02950 [Nannocystis sp.]|nr:hypothetical protein [Nannocystis sp.]MBA3545419.1 hypothetical protein [Nannocystis sp.]
MIRSIPSVFAALLALTFAPGCPADSGDTDTDAATAATTMATMATTGGTMATTGTEPTTGEAPALTCADYCTAITANCIGANSQYSAGDTCASTCAAFPPGTLADTADNTLGCRLYHAGAAKDMPEVHCTHAGPGGADVCGGNCDGFCAIAADACGGTFADDTACQTACAAYDKTESYDASDAEGNTFACRLYHLTVASSSADAATTHCPHILPDSAPCM